MTDGIALARRYYEEIVAPLLAGRWPELPHTAARLGSGSDVLGLDDATSRDHDWGLRLTLLVEADVVDDVGAYLEDHLPDTYADRPTRFATTWDSTIRQRVEVATAEAFVTSRLGLDASREMTSLDWLCLTGQSVLEVTAGAVFTDTLGTLARVRQKLAWYPDPVWRYVVAADWIRLGEDLPLIGRAGDRGDDLGSRVLAARMVDTCVHLAFLLARRWPPYPKWLGTMLTRLPVADDLIPALVAVLAAGQWQERQQASVQALDVLHRAQRGTSLPTPADGVIQPFFGRPFLGVRPEAAALLMSTVTDPLVRRLPPGVGGVDQWIDNVKVLTDPARRVRAARAGLETAAGPAAERINDVLA